MVMVATDGHRLAYVEKQSEDGQNQRSFRALIPRKAMGEIVKLADEAPPEGKSVLPVTTTTCFSSSAAGC